MNRLEIDKSNTIMHEINIKYHKLPNLILFHLKLI